MLAKRKPMQNFNTDTMSGIYPGSRTMIYQRVRLHRDLENGEDYQATWYQLQWYNEPNAAILVESHADKPSASPIFALKDPQRADFIPRLQESLTAAGLKANACFACSFWQPSGVHTDDEIPAGRCRWSDTEAKLPGAIATQSALSLSCGHFQRLDQPRARHPENSTPTTHHPRMLKTAELDPDRLPFWPRVWHRLRNRVKPPPQRADPLMERSGVGAGTEPCFVCQGRLANLGALAVASPEGDKQTLSIWRCRSCYTTYFNDWTDRWERLENLETEERYYRIAPAEAYDGLRIIRATKGGDHPRLRSERHEQRAQMLALVVGKQPLSHQVRQGR